MTNNQPLRAEQLQLFPTESVDSPPNQTEEERIALENEFLAREVERLQEELTEKDRTLHRINKENTEMLVMHLGVLQKLTAFEQSSELFLKMFQTAKEKIAWYESSINHLLFTHILKEGEWSYTFPDGSEWSVGYE